MVAMGKLGGRELNFSSDIDLVLLYRGARARPTVPAAHQQSGVLHAPGAAAGAPARAPHRGGLCVSRGSAPAALSAIAGRPSAARRRLKTTCRSQGRDWERYAWVKARADHQRRGVQRAVSRAHPAVRVSTLSRLRRARIAARDEGADRARGAAARSERQHQARRRRHSRDRIHRAVLSADTRRPGPTPAAQLAAPCAAAASGREAAAGRGGQRSSMRPTCSCAAWRIACRCAPISRCIGLPSESGERERLARSMGFGNWSELERELEGHRALVAGAFSRLGIWFGRRRRCIDRSAHRASAQRRSVRRSAKKKR